MLSREGDCLFPSLGELASEILQCLSVPSKGEASQTRDKCLQFFHVFQIRRHLDQSEEIVVHHRTQRDAIGADRTAKHASALRVFCVGVQSLCPDQCPHSGCPSHSYGRSRVCALGQNRSSPNIAHDSCGRAGRKPRNSLKTDDFINLVGHEASRSALPSTWASSPRWQHCPHLSST